MANLDLRCVLLPVPTGGKNASNPVNMFNHLLFVFAGLRPCQAPGGSNSVEREDRIRGG